MKKRLTKVLAVILGICCLAGCGTSNVPPEAENQTVSQIVQESTTEPEQIDSSGMEQEKKSDAAILVVSFGTSYNDSRDITIGAIEEAISQAYPEYEVRRAFTSQIIIDILKDRENLEIDNVTEALDRAVTDGIKELVVQPTHLMSGFEYNDILAELTEYLDKFDKIILSEPLLTSDTDFDAVIKAITEKTASYDDGETAVCFMGHGTEAESNQVYAVLQNKLTEKGYENYYIGTVEAAPTLDDIIASLKAKGIYKKVVLEPLMVVSGDHARNDMAGEDITAVITLSGTGYGKLYMGTAKEAEAADETEYIAFVEDAEGAYTYTLPSVKLDQPIDCAAYSMKKEEWYDRQITFLSASISDDRIQAVEGTYSIEVTLEGGSGKSSVLSPAVLTVTEDGMTAVIEWNSPNYDYMLVNGEKYLPINTEGNSVFEIPVAELDTACEVIGDTVAMSKPHEITYTLTFHSDTMKAAESE